MGSRDCGWTEVPSLTNPDPHVSMPSPGTERPPLVEGEMKLLRDGLLLSLAVTIMLGVMTLASRKSKVFPQPRPGPIRHWLCGPQASAPPTFAFCEGFPWWVRAGRL